MDDLIRRMRLLEIDHAPDGWPAVQMCDITALLDMIEEQPSGICEVCQTEVVKRLHEVSLDWQVAQQRIAELEQQLAHKQEQCDQLAHQVLGLEQQLSVVHSVVTPKICSLPPLPDPRAKCVEGHDGGFSPVQMYEFAYTAVAIRDAELTDWITKYIIPNHPEAVDAIKMVLFRLV